jgi:hypothetical protein
MQEEFDKNFITIRFFGFSERLQIQVTYFANARKLKLY